MSTGYIVYTLAVLATFLLWGIAFAVMRKDKGKERSDLTGFLLTGPLHFYLKRRRYDLSGRELIGWGVVGLLMLLAPVIAKVL
jgi:hypothetical protein